MVHVSAGGGETISSPSRLWDSGTSCASGAENTARDFVVSTMCLPPSSLFLIKLLNCTVLSIYEKNTRRFSYNKDCLPIINTWTLEAFQEGNFSQRFNDLGEENARPSFAWLSFLMLFSVHKSTSRYGYIMWFMVYWSIEGVCVY